MNRLNLRRHSLNLPRASKLIELAEKEPLPTLEMVHTFVPKYHRLAEAEANWLKAHQKEQKDDSLSKNDGTRCGGSACDRG